MRTLTTLACLALPLLAMAQGPELKLPSFENLQHQAVDSVDVTFGAVPLGLMGLLIDDGDQGAASVKKALAGVKSVRVRSYHFSSDFEYSKADIDAVRAQLSGPGWKQLVQTRDHKRNEAVDVYVAMDNHTITGIAIITSDPRKFTILNVVGSLDMDQVRTLRKTFE
ncbi:MAG TPA: DUF4252 domain-containing protein [Steroidobacteraceae bacterium]|jgi:hypothetical protein